MMENITRETRESQMFALVKTCIEGKVSRKDFCVAHQISPANYYYWQKKYLELQVKRKHSV